MRKKLFLLLIVCLLIFMTACDNPSKGEKSSYSYNYNSKVAIDQNKDGWLHYFAYEYATNDDGSIYRYYGFGGYNLKHKNIEGLVVPIIDSQTGKVIDTSTTSLPYLILDQELKSDIYAMGDFFKEKQFVSPIDISALEELKLSKFNKEEILKLFNQMMESDELGAGKYGYLPQADILQEKLLSGYQWQVGFFLGRGNILKVRIELIYNENTYLSDMIENNQGDEFQRDIYEKIKEIEKEIMEKQSFDVTAYKELNIGDIQFKRLHTLLEKIDSGVYSH